jgi:hypothetical protein
MKPDILISYIGMICGSTSPCATPPQEEYRIRPIICTITKPQLPLDALGDFEAHFNTKAPLGIKLLIFSLVLPRVIFAGCFFDMQGLHGRQTCDMGRMLHPDARQGFPTDATVLFPGVHSSSLTRFLAGLVSGELPPPGQSAAEIVCGVSDSVS